MPLKKLIALLVAVAGAAVSQAAEKVYKTAANASEIQIADLFFFLLLWSNRGFHIFYLFIVAHLKGSYSIHKVFILMKYTKCNGILFFYSDWGYYSDRMILRIFLKGKTIACIRSMNIGVTFTSIVVCFPCRTINHNFH